VSTRISVVVVSYAHEKMIEQAIGSILPQLGPDDELLVCDDCSPDNTVAVAMGCADGDPRVTVVPGAENVGVSANINRGLEVARGEFVAVIAGDDAFCPGKLARQAAVMEADAQCVLVYHDVWVTNEHLQATGERALGRGFHPEGRGIDALLMSHGNFIPGPSGMFRQAAAGHIRFDSRFDMCSDRLFWARCAQEGTTRYIDEPLALYRRHSGSMTGRVPGRARRAYDAANLMLNVAGLECHVGEAAVVRGRALAGWRLLKDGFQSGSRDDLWEGATSASRSPTALLRSIAWDQRRRLPRLVGIQLERRAASRG
jgi:hypothetical protein